MRRENEELLQPAASTRAIQTAVNQRRKNGYRILVLPGDLQGARGTDTPPPGCEARVPEHGRALLRAAPPVPERAEPDRDPRRHERRPHLRRQVQHPDRGHGRRPRATSRSRARRAKLNVIRADRADGIYLKNFTVEYSDFNNIYVLETNGFRIDTIVSQLQPRVRDPLVHLRPRHLRELRRVVQRRLGRLPGLRARTRATVSPTRTATCTGSRSATATRTTTRSGCRARPATAPGRTTTASTTTQPASRPTRSRAATPGMPQDNSKWSHNLIYSNNNNLFNDERDAYCRDTPVGGARPAEGVPDVPGAGRHRASDRRRQRQHRRGELHLRQLAPRHDAALGPGRAARRGGRREDVRHVREQPYLRNCMGTRPLDLDNVDFSACEGHAGPERRRLLVGRGGGPGLHRGAARLRRQRLPVRQLLDRQPRLRRPGVLERPAGAAPARPARGWTSSGPGNSEKQATLVPCATWHPIDNPDPPGLRLVHARRPSPSRTGSQRDS